jgi:transcriptional regulator GlxA family with amidase domain
MRQTANSGDARLSVGFILARNFTLSAFASFVDVLRLSADDGDSSRQILCRWNVLSPDNTQIRSSCGIPLQPDAKMKEPSDFDYIVVVGGILGQVEDLDAVSLAYLRKAAEQNIPLVGLCTGGFILHRAGLMEGRKCCIHWFHHDDFLDQFDGLEPVSDQIFVVDNDRLTCSGGIGSAHLAAYLVARHVGVMQARKSLHIMIIDDVLEGEKPQPGIPLVLVTPDDLVKRALLMMQQNIEYPLPIKTLCERLKVGRRKLERQFRRALEISPLEASMMVRIAHVKHLLTTTKLTISQVALQTGFCDASHLIKVFRQRVRITPDVFRSNIGPTK